MITRWRALALALALVFCGVGPALAADVNAPPVARITGENTTIIVGTSSVALSSTGRRYVIRNDGAVLVFGADQTGNVAPQQLISGDMTELTGGSGTGPRDVEVAPDGRIYVTVGGGSTWKILVFAPGANGNEKPVARIEGQFTGLLWPTGMAFDSQGGLYVANRSANSIAYFAPGVTGASQPSRVIQGPSTGLNDPSDVALDSAGNLHVVNLLGQSITTYAPSAGNDAAPTRTIAGASTGLGVPYRIAVDPLGNLYVANRPTSGGSPAAVLAWPSSAPGGNTAPQARLTGGATEVDDPNGLAVGADSRLTVSDGAAVLTFAPLITTPAPTPTPTPTPTPAVPLKVTKLKVAGKPTGVKWKVTWKAPASTVTGYKVKVTLGKKTLLTKTVTKPKLTLARKKLRIGKVKVTVAAVNDAGRGARTTTTFRVAKADRG